MSDSLANYWDMRFRACIKAFVWSYVGRLVLIAGSAIFRLVICVLKFKCVRYWPEDPDSEKTHDVYNASLKIKHISTATLPNYDLREFELTRTEMMVCACARCFKLKVKRYSSSWQVVSELRGVTGHMGSHSVTCHPIQVNSPRLTPARPAGARFTYPWGMEGWVDLGDLLQTEMVYPPADSHPSKY